MLLYKALKYFFFFYFCDGFDLLEFIAPGFALLVKK